MLLLKTKLIRQSSPTLLPCLPLLDCPFKLRLPQLPLPQLQLPQLQLPRQLNRLSWPAGPHKAHSSLSPLHKVQRRVRETCWAAPSWIKWFKRNNSNMHLGWDNEHRNCYANGVTCNSMYSTLVMISNRLTKNLSYVETPPKINGCLNCFLCAEQTF